MNIQIVDWRLAIADFRDCRLGIEKGDLRLGLSICSIGDCRLAIADWRLPIGDWRLPIGANPQSAKSQIDNPNQQSQSTITNLNRHSTITQIRIRQSALRNQ
jgi:hypothetical protein